MEMGSSSSTSSNSSDSLKGLKFGRKIYFEDVGFAPPPKSGGGSPSSSGSGGQPPKKGRSGGVQGGQPPRCQVEGCRVDLSDAKAYYSRHKVCGMHSKSPKVIVGGLEQRFCQQCSRVKDSSGKATKKCSLRKVFGVAHCIMLMKFPRVYLHPRGEVTIDKKSHALSHGYDWILVSLSGSINFLNLTKEKEVAVDAWLAIMSVGGSHHLDLY
ncbi:hypothetical protein C3L33_12169, partial [Rhododendron williamsianum]